jgi:hypothetical protein
MEGSSHLDGPDTNEQLAPQAEREVNDTIDQSLITNREMPRRNFIRILGAGLAAGGIGLLSADAEAGRGTPGNKYYEREKAQKAAANKQHPQEKQAEAAPQRPGETMSVERLTQSRDGTWTVGMDTTVVPEDPNVAHTYEVPKVPKFVTINAKSVLTEMRGLVEIEQSIPLPLSIAGRRRLDTVAKVWAEGFVIKSQEAFLVTSGHNRSIVFKISGRAAPGADTAIVHFDGESGSLVPDLSFDQAKNEKLLQPQVLQQRVALANRALETWEAKYAGRDPEELAAMRTRRCTELSVTIQSYPDMQNTAVIGVVDGADIGHVCNLTKDHIIIDANRPGEAFVGRDNLSFTPTFKGSSWKIPKGTFSDWVHALQNIKGAELPFEKSFTMGGTKHATSFTTIETFCTDPTTWKSPMSPAQHDARLKVLNERYDQVHQAVSAPGLGKKTAGLK